jgi:hypothetical protein
MKKLDKAALELALETVLQGKEPQPDPGRPDQVRTFVHEDGFEYAAKFCSSLLQRRHLQLRPWQRPPCRSEPHDGSEGGQLLARMLAAGVSRYEPNPLAALEGASNDTVINPGIIPSPNRVRHDGNTRGTKDGGGSVA